MATITPELRQELQEAGDEPVRVEDLETKQSYVIVREDVYLKLRAPAVIDHNDRSFYEFGEFYPDK